MPNDTELTAYEKQIEVLRKIASGDIECSSLQEWRSKVMKMAQRALKYKGEKL